ncbi:MAG: hypothetical protein ACKOPS_21835 [Cyanobium sp.]
MRPTVIRLSDDVLDWLDAHRGDEPRVALIRSILREHIRRHARSASRAASRARTRVHAASATAPDQHGPSQAAAPFCAGSDGQP